MFLVPVPVNIETVRTMSKSISEAYAYCKRKTLESDSNFALSFRFLPKIKRNAIYAVYAFNRSADDFADELSDIHESVDKLELWEKLLHECYRGNPGEHPLMIAFTDTIDRFNIPKKPFLDAIQGYKADLTINRYKSFKDLCEYCDLVAGTISTISLHVFGFTDTKAFDYGRDLSYALQLTNIIRDVGTDVQKNRIYLPLDELDRFNYSEEELHSYEYNDTFLKLMRFQINRAREYFRTANPLIELIPDDSRFTVVMIGGIYYRLLEKIEKSGIPVLNDSVHLSKWEKLYSTFRLRIKPTFV